LSSCAVFRELIGGQPYGLLFADTSCKIAASVKLI
jgi:hypothetical protein